MTQQRIYRAACPNCGAPVEFRSAASRLAVCEFCRSTLSRDGDALARIGQMAELFDDHSPLQLGAAGVFPSDFAKPVAEGGLGLAGSFTVLGRLQNRYAEGVWNEWHLMADDGGRAWLSEDNGGYALSSELGDRLLAQPVDKLVPGELIEIDGRSYNVSSITEAMLNAAAGELPFAPVLNQPFQVVEARQRGGDILSLDFSNNDLPRSARAFLGRTVRLADLSMSGLRDESAKTLAGKGFPCPNCGSAVEVKLDGSKSVTCAACASVVDLTQSDDGKPVFTTQSERFESPIPLGTVGTVDGIAWQAVGFARRSGVDNDGERFSWGEVLLYNRSEGFAFVVVSSEAVSLVRTVSDLPAAAFTSIKYQNRQYRGQPAYKAVVDYVEGEFYWQVRIGQRTRNLDYESGDFILSREETVEKKNREVVWSHGRKYKPAELAKAFGLPDISQLPYQGLQLSFGDSEGAAGSALGASALKAGAAATSVAPTSGSKAVLIIIIVVIAIIVLSMIFAESGGGSGSSSGYGGGRSSGGGHK